LGASAKGRLLLRLPNKGEEWSTPEKVGQLGEVFGSNHHMGTTRMSNTEKTGVVDKHCKVYGVTNLYIAGSSVFPTSGFANPTLTIVALAHRLADKIKKELA